MKLQKVFVILGISACLVATEMQATFGIDEEPGQEEDKETIDKEEEEKLKEAAKKEEKEGTVKPAEKEKKEPAEQIEVSKPVYEENPGSETIKTDEGLQQEELFPQDDVIEDGFDNGEIPETEAGIEETPEEAGTPTEEAGTEEGEVPKEEDGTGEEVPKEEDGTEEEVPKEEDGTGEEPPAEEDGTGEEVPKEEDGTGEEIPKEEDGTGEEPPAEGDGTGEEVPKEEDGTEEEVPEEDSIGEEKSPAEEDGTGEEAPKEAHQKKRNEAVKGTLKHNHMFSSFTPSSEFIDNREKIKYNVEVPVEGLPCFITQEMLVGALKCQDETGYPASVTIAQIIQESGFGKYGPDGDKGQGLSYLAYQYNNLFGIKGSGTAGSVAMHTGEQRLDGTRYNITAGFRVYNTYTECIEDRTELLERVYKDLTFGVKDANTFAMRIAKRWATSLSYGQNLIRQMSQYDLYRLDSMTLEEFSGMIGTFANPCPGSRLTSGFGYRQQPIAGASTYHKGIDMGTGEYNIPTYAAQAGTVTYADFCGAAGNLVTIDHGNGLVTKYMHHDKIYVKQGDRVEKGQQIGLSGTTGNSTGNHLHFQVEKDGMVINPLYYLDIQ